MKIITWGSIFAIFICASLFFTGCDDGEYNIPEKTGGGGQSQPYVPAGNANGGQYLYLEKK